LESSEVSHKVTLTLTLTQPGITQPRTSHHVQFHPTSSSGASNATRDRTPHTSMAENQNPTASTAANADQPGRPYYESLRNALRQTLDKKKKLDDALSKIEDDIFKNEGAYLEETAASGNIVRGFDGWVKGVAVGGRGGDDRRRGRVRDEDRIFSRSSVSWSRV